MIIHQPEIIRKDGYAILWSRIEMAKKRDNFPDFIWYRVPERYAPFLSLQSDAFLVASLLAGMYYGEAIEVRGTVSPRLAYHLEEYQFVLNFRMPELVHPVAVQYECLAPMEGKPTGVGTTFSGGVDSLFTLWKHLPKNQSDPNYQVTHGLFIRGFNLIHTEEPYYRQLYNRYQEVAADIGLDLIELHTNMMGIIQRRMDSTFMNGPLILSAAIALQGLFCRFYMPSTWDYHNLKSAPHASDPLVDGFLPTNTLDIIHHGSTFRRVEKVEEVADWELAQEILHVCFDLKFEKTTWNCSRCEKCVRTMIPLYALGKMEKFKTFEKPLITNRDGLWWARKFNLKQDFVSEMFPFVNKHKPDLLPWLYIAALLGFVRYKIIRNIPRFLMVWLRRHGHFVTRREAPHIFEIPEITHLIQSMNDHPSA